VASHPCPAPADLATVFIREVRGLPELTWAEGMHICLPRDILADTGLVETLDNKGQVTISADLRRPAPHHADSLRLRRAFTDRAPTSSRLPFPYHRVPAWLRNGIASLLGRRQKKRAHIWAAFPRWPLDLSADFLADWAAGPAATLAQHGPTPVLLTHDLDSPEGVTNLVHLFLNREERHGARSSNFVVPCAWPLDHGLLGEIRQRGHTLGVHGYDHANRTSFVSAADRLKRLTAGKDMLADYEADGYRAPSLLRTRPLLQDLERFYRFDSSIPTSGGLFPTPNNGCASARPFLLGGLRETPLSLPRDGSLRFFGHRPAEIRDLWIACARTIARSRGVVVLLTHCERRFSGNSGMLQAYEEFLDFIASSAKFRFSSFPEVLSARLPSWSAPAQKIA
jgi:peptidoglycan/xylan/chitin deacetylase (PgdA/CDA1 family)